MDQLRDFREEQAYTERVQQLMLAIIEQADIISGSHSESIHAIIADAWEELRVRPTQLSVQDLEQLSVELNRITARREFTRELAERYRRMLMNPFFARVDFIEKGENEIEKIVIGLYSLGDEKGKLLVHDWRAPVCSLYYDSEPGDVSYNSPSGAILGKMTLKRQYRMENGQLKYYVDTHLSIDDSVLLDILSGASSHYMRQIVATIQAEQNAAIRSDDAPVVCVVGSAGSGKTSVAMHRAAFLMYRRRDILDASKIQIISPSTAFSEYVSNVLPELGEENIRARTMRELVEHILGRKVEPLVRQMENLLEGNEDLRYASVAHKTGIDFLRSLRKTAESFATFGPNFGNVRMDDQILIRREELRRMYKNEFSLLSPAQRVERLKATLDTRMASWEEKLIRQYEQSYAGKYSGKDLKFVAKMAAVQQLQGVRAQLRKLTNVNGWTLLQEAMKDAPKALRDAFFENKEANLLWWEDAAAQAYLLVQLGFVQPDKSVYHLLVDECQDYSETELALLHAYFPNARVTLLGDPMQRTCPGMNACEPANWGECFEVKDAPLFNLTRCYRSTLPITRLCNALLPGGERLNPFGREGEMPLVAQYSEKLLKDTLEKMRREGHSSIAVITRTQAQADSLSTKLENVYRLDGGDEDLNYESTDNVVGCYHMVKGMEFDAVIVVWPEAELTDGERRRLYTACSRALHSVALLGGGKLIKELGIVL
ncbi:MAG: AAA family ATPase [Clostridia bacterium]|nr:AAA family ATPase [Clostridia bacterium]